MVCMYFLFLRDGSASKLIVIKVTIFHVLSDVNEEPVGVCDQPFAMGISASVGSVVTDLKGLDPDNLAHVNDDSSSAPSYVGRKQALSYFLESGSSSPFEIRQEQLFKNKVDNILMVCVSRTMVPW